MHMIMVLQFIFLVFYFKDTHLIIYTWNAVISDLLLNNPVGEEKKVREKREAMNWQLLKLDMGYVYVRIQ